VDPQDKRHPKFKYVAHHKLPLLSKDLQKKGIDQAEWI
jgi:glycyl-tRNA synthetase (class II)